MKWKKIMCSISGWHKPIKAFAVDGIRIIPRCERCGKRIARNSQGKWFEL